MLSGHTHRYQQPAPPPPPPPPSRRGHRAKHKQVNADRAWHLVGYDGPESDSPIIEGHDLTVKAAEIAAMRHALDGVRPKGGEQSLPPPLLLEIYAGCVFERRGTGERFSVPSERMKAEG